MNVAPTQLAQGKVNRFRNEPGILKVAIDDAQIAHAVTHEFLDHVLERVHQSRAIKAGRAGKEVSATGFLVRFVSVGERRRDKGADLLVHAAGEFGRQKHIDMHRHMMAVLLH